MSNMSFSIPAICGMGLNFELDGFRILYCTIAVFMWAMTALFNPEYMKHYGNKVRYYVFTWITFAATIGVFLSADLYTTFIFFEIMSFTSYVWVAQDERKESLRAAGTYLAVAVIGGLVMLMGIFMLYNMAGTLNFSELRAFVASYDGSETMLWASGICILFGFGAKAGAFPLHIWLPKAHPVAPAPASALLSGILTKAGVFGILVLSCYMFEGNRTWGMMITYIAVCTMVLGALLALFSVDLKRTLACSSVSQIGFILTAIGMAGILGEENGLALRGGLLHMVNHSLIKLTLFMAAGVVYMNLHKLNLNDIRGFGRKKPILNFVFLMGALGIGGIPLWNGYVSKTLIHEAIVESGMTTVEWLFLISGGFTVAYMLKLYICIFVEKNTDELIQKQFDEKKKYMNLLSAIALVLSAVTLPILGFNSSRLMIKLADMGATFLNAADAEAVNFFSWESLKGGAISIGIGVVLYFAVVRLLLMKKTQNGHEYVNRWPSWLDLENFIYRPILLHALPFVFGVICRVLDGAVDAIVVFLRKTIYADSPIITERVEGTWFSDMCGNMVNRLKKGTDKDKTDYRHKYALRSVVIEENRVIIYRSLSFGLILFCVGLLLTVIYLVVRYL